jgi:hypothetical protein
MSTSSTKNLNEPKKCDGYDCDNHVYTDAYGECCSQVCLDEIDRRFNIRFPYHKLILQHIIRDNPCNSKCETNNCDMYNCYDYYNGYGFICYLCIEKFEKAKQTSIVLLSRGQRLCTWCMEAPIAPGFYKFCSTQCAKDSHRVSQSESIRDKRSRDAEFRNIKKQKS